MASSGFGRRWAGALVAMIVVLAGSAGCSSSTAAGICAGVGASSSAPVVKVALPVLPFLIRNPAEKTPRKSMEVEVVKRGSVLVFARELEPDNSGSAVKPPTAGLPLRRCAPYTYWASDLGSAVVTTTFTTTHFGHNVLGLAVKVVDR